MNYENKSKPFRVKAWLTALVLCILAAIIASGAYTGAYTARADTAEPTKYSVTLPSASAQVGYTIHSKIAGQTEVTAGSDYTFVFGVLADYSKSDYSVYVNGEKIDVSGTNCEYTITKVYEPIVITVSGVTKNKYSVTLPSASEQKGYKLEFVSGGTAVEAGTEVAVKFTISDTNAKAKYTLYVNGAEKSVGADGVYRETANGDMSFTVTYRRPVKVNFNLNGGSGETTGGMYYAYGDSVPLNMKPEITREGYTFYGWSESPSATRPEFREGAETSLVIGDEKAQITLYAIWKPNETTEVEKPETLKTWQYGVSFGAIGAVLVLFTVLYLIGRKRKMKKLPATDSDNATNGGNGCNGDCTHDKKEKKDKNKKADKTSDETANAVNKDGKS